MGFKRTFISTSTMVPAVMREGALPPRGVLLCALLMEATITTDPSSSDDESMTTAKSKWKAWVVSL